MEMMILCSFPESCGQSQWQVLESKERDPCFKITTLAPALYCQLHSLRSEFLYQSPIKFHVPLGTGAG